MKAGPYKIWGKKGIQVSQKVLENVDKFLEESYSETSQKAHLKFMEMSRDKLVELVQLIGGAKTELSKEL